MGRRRVQNVQNDEKIDLQESVFDTLINIAEMNTETPELDLHGMDVFETEYLIEDFLDKEFLDGTKVVKITHGIGRGILANNIPDMLKKNKHVAYFKLGCNFGISIIAVLK